MERMYQEYKDIAEFRMIYINEAHAADGPWPIDSARDLGITEHTDIEERCTTAQMLVDDKSLTIPFLIDDMADAVNKAYSAWPDRIFVVRTDGRLAIAAARGPAGFLPALRQTKAWLEAFRSGGEEPHLPPSAVEPGEEIAVEQPDRAATEADEDKRDEREQDGNGGDG